MTTLTVVAPVYNEERVIKQFHDELFATLDSLPAKYSGKVLFVVDRCTDSTRQIIEQLCANNKRVQALFLSARFGHQMSLVAGIENSDADVLIMMDCDLQHPPALIPKMLSYYEQGYDIVYTLRESNKKTPWFRRLVGEVFYRMLTAISDTKILENAADFRLISARVAKVFKEQIHEQNQFLRGMFSWVGFKSIGVPFSAEERSGDKSKYTWLRLMRFASHGIVSFSKRPLQISSFFGLAMAFTGFIYSGYVVYSHYTNSSIPLGYSTLVILILFFGGIQLISMGILGMYLGAIFDEVKARPRYIIDSRVNL